MKLISGVVLMATLAISGCAYYSKMAVPMSPMEKEKIEMIEHISRESQSVRLFMLGGVPSAMDMVKEAIAELNGDGIVNLEVTLSEGFFGPITFPKVTIEGDVVRVRSNESYSLGPAIHQPIEKLRPEVAQAVAVKPELKTAQIDSVEMIKWKSEVLAAKKNSWVIKGFSKFQKRTDQNIEYSDWVLKLTTTDFLDYQTSDYNVIEWVLEKLKKERN